MRITLLFVFSLLSAALLPAQHLREIQDLTSPLGGTVEECAITLSPSSNMALSAMVVDVGGLQQIWAMLGDRRDGGKSWQPDSAALRLDGDLSGAHKHALRVNCTGNEFQIAWLDDRNGSNASELFMVTVDASPAALFSGEQIIPSNDASLIKDVKAWDWVSSDDELNVLCRSSWTSSREALFLSHSSDAGTSWVTPLLVSSNPPGQDDVDHFAIGMQDDGNLLVAWFDNRSGKNQVFARQGDGLSWLDIEQVLDDPTQGKAVDGLVVGASLSGFSVAWCQEGNSTTNESLWLNVFEEVLDAWQGPQLVGAYTVGTDDVDYPSLDCVDDSILLSWEDNRSGKDLIYSCLSEDFGHSFLVENLHSLETGAEPQVLFMDDTLVLAWREVGNDHLMLDVSLDGGLSWNGKLELSGGVINNDVDAFCLAGESNWRNVLVAGLYEQLGVNQMFVGGFRFGNLSAHGSLDPGAALSFSLENVPQHQESWWFEVECSSASGEWNPPLLNGRWAEISANDFYFAQMRSMRWRGKIINGVAITPDMVVPQLPSGLSLHFVGITRSEYPWPGGNYGTISDPLVLSAP